MATDFVSAPAAGRNRSAVREQLAQRTRSFTELAQTVRSRGLNNRTRGFYLVVGVALVVALGGAFTGLALLRESWFLLLIPGDLHSHLVHGNLPPPAAPRFHAR